MPLIPACHPVGARQRGEGGSSSSGVVARSVSDEAVVLFPSSRAPQG